MSASRYISREIKKIDKRRTLSLLGFLFILAFFPVVFSSSSKPQETRSQAASLDNQQVTSVKFSAQATTPTTAQPLQQATTASQSSLQSSSSSAQGPAQLNADEVYSPQPSIWLFIIPIAVTFFTILFY